MRTETIKLAGVEHVIRELPLRKNAEWRSQAAAAFAEVTALLDETQQLELSAADAGNVFALLRRAGDVVFRSPDTVVNLVYAYAPELAGASDDIYESELMEAFAACLRLAFPFGKVTRLLGTLMATGSVPTPTLTTSVNSSHPATATPNG